MTAALVQPGSEPDVTARRPATPVVLQAQVCDCGVAALGIVLAHYRRAVPLVELRRQAGVTRDGISAGNLLRVARAHGLEAKGWRKDPDGLPQLGFPLIAHCGFNHFIVVEGMAGDRVWINDPVRGPGLMHREQFDHAFTGVALSFAIAAPPAGRPLPVWRQVVAVRPRLLPGWAWPIAAAIAAGSLSAAAAVLLGRAVDGETAVLPWLPPVLLLAGLIAYDRERRRQRWAAAQADACLAADLDHLWRLPMAFFTYRGHAVASRVFAGATAAATLGGPLAEAALAVIGLGPPLVAALLLDPATGAGLLGVTVAALAAIAWQGLDRATIWRGSVLAGMSRTRLPTGVFLDMEAVRLGGRSDEILSETNGLQARNLHDGDLAVLPQASLSAVPLLLAGAPLLVPLLAAGGATPGRLVSLALLALLLGEALALAWQKAAAVRVLYHWLLIRLDLRQEPVAPAIPTLTGGLAAHGVTFGYHRQGKPLLTGVTLSVGCGEAVGLAGAGGAGKSTLAQILAGLLPPWSGMVSGVPVLVDNRPLIFEASLRDAVRLWQPRHDDEAIRRALADAGLGGLLDEREGGLDMPILARGTNLSGGQRLRLALARALLDDPAALVLDETFDALDGDIEQHIRTALRRRGCALLVISHRETTLAACDRVLTLVDGKVLERGRA